MPAQKGMQLRRKRPHMQIEDQEEEAVKVKQSKQRKVSRRLLIEAPEILYGKEWRYNHTVIIEYGHISAVMPTAAVRKRSGDEVHSYSSATLSPGFIDILIHGADGHDVMDGTAEAILAIANKLKEEGTTSFLPSTMTASQEGMLQAATMIRQAMERQTIYQTAIIGWHAEGPYFAVQKIGCHDPACRQDPNIDQVEEWRRVSNDSLKMITIAPELPTASLFIRWAKAAGITASIGHTIANYEQTWEAIGHGATAATHLFNAMNNGNHQVAGCSAAIQGHPGNIFYTLIVDGIHIHPGNILVLARQFDFAERAILVTDGIRAKYKKDGTYFFGGQDIVVKGREARLKKGGNLAGSILKMNEAVANLLAYAPHISRATALLMASYNPARAINEFRKGLVLENYEADITLLDDAYNVLAVYRAGTLIHQGPALMGFTSYQVP